jgi:hypothetical protein
LSFTNEDVVAFLKGIVYAVALKFDDFSCNLVVFLVPIPVVLPADFNTFY